MSKAIRFIGWLFLDLLLMFVFIVIALCASYQLIHYTSSLTAVFAPSFICGILYRDAHNAVAKWK